MELNMRRDKRQSPIIPDKTVSTFNASNNILNEDEALKTSKTHKSNFKLLNNSNIDKEADKNSLNPENSSKTKAEKAVKEYQIELEKNIGIPRYFKNLFYISPQMKQTYYILKKKLKIVDSLLCIISLIAILFAILDTDIVVVNFNIFEEEFIITDVNNVYRAIIIGINIITVYLIILRYKILLKEHIITVGTVSSSDNLFTSNLFFKLLGEIVINSIFNPPVVNTHFEMKGTVFVVYDYSIVLNTKYLSFNANSTVLEIYKSSLNNTQLNELEHEQLQSTSNSIRMLYNVSPLITFLILLRLYHLFRVIHTFSYWNTLQAQSVSNNMRCDADLSFGLRAYLKMKPFISLTFSVIFVILFFGVGEFISENYNEIMTDMLSPMSPQWPFVQVMQKFTNMYNSFWLVVVTMTTIGYGDIFPTTYFGRTFAIFACFCGTFIMSLLVVFLNNAISFDEVEKHVYNEIVDEKFSIKAVQKEAVKLIYKSLEYNYLRRVYPKQTALFRFKILYVDLKYMTRNFKMKRIVSRKNEIDIDEILGGLKYNLDFHITPFKNSIDEYNRERLIFDHSFNYLKDSVQLCDKYNKNSMQIINLLKIMNKDKYLEGLNNIEEVYDSQVNIIEEVVYYHKYREKLEKIADEEEIVEKASIKSEEESEESEDNSKTEDEENESENDL